MELNEELNNEFKEYGKDLSNSKAGLKYSKGSLVYKVTKKWGSEMKENPSKIKVIKRNFFSKIIFRIKKYFLKLRLRKIEKMYNNNVSTFFKKLQNDRKNK